MNVIDLDGRSAKLKIPQVEDTSAQGLNSPLSIPNSQGSNTDGLDEVSLNPRVDGDMIDKQTGKSGEGKEARPP